MPAPTRRSFLQSAGTVALPTTIGSRLSKMMGEHGDEWRIADTPTSETLQDAVFASNGPYAVGSNGVVLARSGTGWERVLRNGPNENGNNLVAAAATHDGGRLWVAGASGALGEYDPATGALVDRTAPGGVTTNFTSVAVTGPAGDANVFVADDSGSVHASFENGRDGSWTHQIPGSGASIRSIDLYDRREGVLVDGSQSVFRTTDGESWTRIGVKDADHSLYTVDANDPDSIYAAGGAIYTRTDAGWQSVNPTGKTLQDVAVGRCGCIHAVGPSGLILHRPGHEMPGVRTVSRLLGLWSQSFPVGENLHGIALGPPHVAVGAAGTVLER